MLSLQLVYLGPVPLGHAETIFSRERLSTIYFWETVADVIKPERVFT